MGERISQINGGTAQTSAASTDKIEIETAGSPGDSGYMTLATARLLFEQPKFRTLAGTAYPLTSVNQGEIVYFTSSSAVTVTIDDALANTGFQCTVVQGGTGTVSIAIEGTDTVNGGTSAVALAGQYKGAFIFENGTGGDWIALV